MSTAERGRRTGGDQAGSAPVDPVGALAARWADAVAGTSYVPLPPDEVEELLRGLLSRLLVARGRATGRPGVHRRAASKSQCPA